MSRSSLESWTHSVELEQEEELAQVKARLEAVSGKTAQAKGEACLEVCIENVKLGWFEKIILTVCKRRNTDEDSPQFRNGEILGIFRWQRDADLPLSAGALICTCVVRCSQGRSLQVVLEPSQYETLQQAVNDTELCKSLYKFNLGLIGSEVTYNRRLGILKELESKWPAYTSQGALADFIQGSDAFRRCRVDATLGGHLDQLNEMQKLAVEFCLEAEPMACLHGPPGTGKTTTVAALIACLVASGHRVLATAPSNVAVDNMMDRCKQLSCVRLGHQSRVLEGLHRFTFEARASKMDSAELCKDIRLEIASVLCIKDGPAKKLAKGDAVDRIVGKSGTENKRAIRQEAKRELADLRKELRRREANTTKEVFNTSACVFATCCGCMSPQLRKHVTEMQQPFDYVIIDEAGQCTELETMMAIVLARKVILAGDPKQLPATVKSVGAVKNGFALSLLDRMMALHPECTVQLTQQYRMNSEIMEWSSKNFYDGTLIADESVARWRLAEGLDPLRWLDTANIDDSVHEDGTGERYSKDPVQQYLAETSKSNAVEAELVCRYIENVIAPFLDGSTTVGVISPYARQMKVIRELIAQRSWTYKEQIVAATVDGFQGQECDVIIISLVRSNSRREVGFLDDPRRLNVAVTRAKKHVCVIGDSSTTTHSTTLNSLFEYICAKNQDVSALAYMTIDEMREVKQRAEVFAAEKPPPVPVFPLAEKGGATQQKQQPDRKAGKGAKKKLSPRKEEVPVAVRVPAPKVVDVDQPLSSDILISIDLAAREEVTLEKLTAYERLHVHRLAEERGLKHTSQDTPDGHRIMILAPMSDPTPIVESKHRERAPDASEAGKKPAKAAKTKKSKKNASKIKPLIPDEPADDDDALLNAMIAQSELCSYVGCSERITTLRVKCRYCGGKCYCFKHAQPEIHGCGERARLAGRANRYIHNGYIG